MPFLPSGDYTVTFELQGFAALMQTVSLKMADRLPLNVKLTLASVTEVVNVTAEAVNTATTPTVATTANVTSMPTAAFLTLVGATPVVTGGTAEREPNPPGHGPRRRKPPVIDIESDDEEAFLTLFAA